MKGYPKLFITLMAAGFMILVGSGLALVPNLLVFKWDVGLDSHLEGGMRVKVAAAHLAAAIACVWFVGALWPVHMRAGLRRKQNRFSGVALVAVLSTLVATGIASYYLGDEDWQKFNSAGHLGAGLLLILMLTAHWIHGRRIIRKSRQARHE